MEFFYSLLADALAKQISPEMLCDLSASMETAAFKTLSEIKAVLENEALNDDTCFLKIEEIVRVFERHSVGIDGRHDFG